MTTLTMNDADDIRKLYADNWSIPQIMQRYGVSRSIILGVINSTCTALYDPKWIKPHRRKLSEMASIIMQLYTEGLSATYIQQKLVEDYALCFSIRGIAQLVDRYSGKCIT
jgi:hypothetical protein